MGLAVALDAPTIGGHEITPLGFSLGPFLIVGGVFLIWFFRELRRGDFDGTQQRLERLAARLRPEMMAFVGKAAYQGAFGVKRCELGLQERTLDTSRLFVLPSTSPGNPAVPYEERLRWFSALAAELDRAKNEAAGV